MLLYPVIYCYCTFIHKWQPLFPLSKFQLCSHEYSSYLSCAQTSPCFHGGLRNNNHSMSEATWYLDKNTSYAVKVPSVFCWKHKHRIQFVVLYTRAFSWCHKRCRSKLYIWIRWFFFFFFCDDTPDFLSDGRELSTLVICGQCGEQSRWAGCLADVTPEATAGDITTAQAWPSIEDQILMTP